MYCKNCGQELENGAVVCLKCGFATGTGEKFCAHCGKEVAPGQALCIGCGFWLKPQNETAAEQKDVGAKTEDSESEEKAAVKETPKKKRDEGYKSYIETTKKINLFRLIGCGLQILLILMLVFLPIYTCKYQAELDDIESWEQYEEVLENDGWLTKNFSLFDDIMLMVNQFFGEESVEVAGMDMSVMSLLLGMMALFEIIFAVVAIGFLIPVLIKAIREISDPDSSTLLLYTEIKKSGSAAEDKNVLKKTQRSQFGISLVILAVFDVIFTKMMGMMFEDLPGDILEGVQARYMSNISGVSPIIILLVAFLVGVFVMKGLEKNEDSKMRVEIARETL